MCSKLFGSPFSDELEKQRFEFEELCIQHVSALSGYVLEYIVTELHINHKEIGYEVGDQYISYFKETENTSELIIKVNYEFDFSNKTKIDFSFTLTGFNDYVVDAKYFEKLFGETSNDTIRKSKSKPN